MVVVAKPLDLIMVRYLPSRGAAVVGGALQAIINELKARGFKPISLLFDGEGAVAKVAATWATGIPFNPAGPKQHVPVVENAIRRIKERVRAVINALPYAVPAVLLKWAVLYCVTRINMTPSATHMDATSPREKFYGRKTSEKVDLAVGFGEYVQAFDANVVKNSMQARTESCIALCPVGNLQGSVKFYNLATKAVVTRDAWKVLPVPDAVIKELNSMASAELSGTAKKLRRVDPVFARGESSRVVFVDDAAEVPPAWQSGLDPPTLPAGGVGSSNVEVVDLDDGVPDSVVPPPARVEQRMDEGEYASAHTGTLSASPTAQPVAVDTDEQQIAGVPPAAQESHDEGPATDGQDAVFEAPEQEFVQPLPTNEAATGGHDETVSSTAQPAADDEPGQLRRNPARSNRTTWKDRVFTVVGDGLAGQDDRLEKLVMQISVAKAKKQFGVAADKAIEIEVQQFLDYGVWTFVTPDSLSKAERAAVIWSSMFLREKFKSDGSFEKLKARLVASGNQQDRGIYETVSSPTVKQKSVTVVAGIAAALGWVVVTVDIVGAYLKINMTGPKVHVRLQPQVVQVLLKMRPDLKGFLLRDGTLIVQLEKAMYGTLQAALLLYQRVDKALVDAGFAANPYDQCVYNRGQGDDRVTVCVYVDDIMVTGQAQAAVDKVIDMITGVFNDVKVHKGKVHSYLGMTFDFSHEGECRMSMVGYVRDLVKCVGIAGQAASPATSDLFVVRPDAQPLDAARKKQLHTGVAKLLFAAKRVLIDTLVAVSFLTTRVTAPDEDDWNKFVRVMKYVNAHGEDAQVVLRFKKDMQVEAFIDASHGTHVDGKSHTGAGITMGGGLFSVSSTKQKLTTKSSTESELVGVSDRASDVIETRLFVEHQGFKQGPAIIWQDNMSTLKLIENGRGSADRTRHINIRYFFVKDRVDAGELVFKYLPTQCMLADLFTKPLQGRLFRTLRDAAMRGGVPGRRTEEPGTKFGRAVPRA
jgi:hypothetical protein